jgi:hypothetical protein
MLREQKHVLEHENIMSIVTSMFDHKLIVNNFFYKTFLNAKLFFKTHNVSI